MYYVESLHPQNRKHVVSNVNSNFVSNVNVKRQMILGIFIALKSKW